MIYRGRKVTVKHGVYFETMASEIVGVFTEEGFAKSLLIPLR